MQSTQKTTQQNADEKPSGILGRWVWVVLAVALVWRIVLAVLMPSLSRDGVKYCWYARDLGSQGLGFLKSADAQQHPLYPTVILGIERLAQLFGAGDTPTTWQVCGQLAALVSGVAVLVFSTLIAIRVVRVLKLEIDVRLVAICAALLAAFLPLNVITSVDAMSDQCHLTFYLAGVWLLLDLKNWRSALGVGLCSGLAFLVRPEGGAVLAGGLACLLAMRNVLRWRRVLVYGVAAIVGFFVLVGPFWLVSGKITLKKNPLELFQDREVADVGGGVAGDELSWARLSREEVADWALVPVAAKETMRAGRVIVPALAIVALVMLRRQLLQPGVWGMATCFLLHFLASLAVLRKEGYLGPRHVLVLVMLLMPFAAIAMVGLRDILQRQGRVHLWLLCVGVLVFPLAFYALRLPNAPDGYLREAGAWLANYDPQIRDKRLMCESLPRRIPFYADCAWIAYAADYADPGDLPGHVLDHKPDYVAIEVGPGDERQNNDVDQAAMEENQELAARMSLIHSKEIRRNEAGEPTVLFIYAFDWD